MVLHATLIIAHHFSILTSSSVASPFLLIAPWQVNRQRYMGRCMWNGIRQTLACQKTPIPLEVLGIIKMLILDSPWG